MLSNITFVIFTYNEERRIESVIKNYKSYGKVLLADGGSTDNTHNIAKSYNCEVFVRPQTNHAFVENAVVMDALYKVLDTEWIFLGYADELMSKDTLDEVARIVNSDKYDAINITRKNYFYGDYCNDAYKSANSRFFKVGAYDFTNNYIHGMGEPTIKKDKIYSLPHQYFIHHFIDGTVNSHITKLNKYTDSEMESPLKPQAKTSVISLLYILTKNLIKNYFFEKGYKTGFAALTLTELTIFYSLIRNIKAYEESNKITNVNIEEKNDLHRKRILEDFS
jgi:glycosyltransferase involved in cell wall biosynthesis